MLSLEPFTEDQGRSAVQPTGGSHQSASLRLNGFTHPVDSHTCQTPWSVFQDGPNGEPTGRRPERARAETRHEARAAVHNRNDDVSTSISTARAWATAAIRVGQCPESIGGPAHTVPHPTGTHRRPPYRFPPDNFKHSLTLFSKSFSSFPRGTCSLSVSRLYLALDGIYRPIWGCIPKQPDSPTAPRGATGSGHNGALTLSGAPFQGTLGPVRH
ncbi:hypothetical protein VNO80_34421 [Phaseolus coccineus]|uniref:Protein TAR1 n=1 Tax=Phaseolus coccineus TaxID=3886 RepID=A0AAN9Q837_PHACN